MTSLCVRFYIGGLYGNILKHWIYKTNTFLSQILHNWDSQANVSLYLRIALMSTDSPISISVYALTDICEYPRHS